MTLGQFVLSQSTSVSTRALRVLPCIGGRPFWMGVIVLGLLGVCGVLGVVHVARGALAEHRLMREGVHADARVLAKETMVPVTVGPAQPSYLVTYCFQSPAGPVTAQARLNGRQGSALRVGSAVGVRYRPGQPDDNMPEGATRRGRDWLWGGVSLGSALFCGLLLGGLVAARRRELAAR
jgi:hypothetical protein